MTLLIVDGYNVLHAEGRYMRRASDDLDAARGRLIDDLASLAGEGLRVAVVFDGAANPESDGAALETGGVSVVFSPHGIDADTVVERMAAEARQAGEGVAVVTSDLETARAVTGDGVRVVSAANFLGELETAEADRGEHQFAGRSKSTIESRLRPDVRATLLRILGG